MCSALKKVVCVAAVLAVAVASKERNKRADYDTLSGSPWQSPTSWGYRPYSNYNNIPSTRISRVNNNNPYQNGGRNQLRNSGQNSELYRSREQSSGWIPITRNQQNYVGRNEQNRQQRQQGYSRHNAYNTINVEEQFRNERIRQRQPSYLVQGSRGNEVLNQQATRPTNGKLLIQLNQTPSQRQVYRNINQGGQDYWRYSFNPLNNGQVNTQTGRTLRPTYHNRIVAGGNTVRWSQRDPEEQRNQLGGEFNQQSLGPSITSELPVIEGRFLGVKVQESTPIVEPEQTNAQSNQQVFDLANSGHVTRSQQLSSVQEQLLGVNSQQTLSGYAVKEPTDEAQNTINQDNLRALNSQHLLRSNQLAGVQRGALAGSIRQEIPSSLAVQDINQSNVGLKQSLELLNLENLRSRELQALRESHLRNGILQNDQQFSEQGVDTSSNNGRYTHTVALVNSRPILNPNQSPAVQSQLFGTTDQQYVNTLNRPSSQLLKLIPRNEPWIINNDGRFSAQSSERLNSESSPLSNQLPNGEWKQSRLSSLDELRNNEEFRRDALTAGNPNDVSASYQTQQGINQNDANQQPDVYTYAEITARIWKLIKSNPAMMSNLQNLREQLLNGRDSRNEQMRELEGLLREARKFNRNSATPSTEQAAQTLEQQKRDAFLAELINTMNRNDIDSNSLDSRRQVSYNGNERSIQARYRVRPADVNPLIKNILISNARRNETETENTAPRAPAPLVFRPKTNVPLPQLEVAEPFGLEQLEHHYDLTQWKQATEALQGNPFLQQYNLLDHLL